MPLTFSGGGCESCRKATLPPSPDASAAPVLPLGSAEGKKSQANPEEQNALGWAGQTRRFHLSGLPRAGAPGLLPLCGCARGLVSVVWAWRGRSLYAEGAQG